MNKVIALALVLGIFVGMLIVASITAPTIEIPDKSNAGMIAVNKLGEIAIVDCEWSHGIWVTLQNNKHAVWQKYQIKELRDK
jgi:hypothetical protein